MNENLTKFFNELNNGATWSAGVAFKRAAALPLEKYSVFATYAEAEKYITQEGSVAYPGQVIAAVKEGSESELGIYYIAEDKTLKEVGTTTLGDDSSIIITENEKGQKVLSIKGFKEAATKTRLIKNSEGELAWETDSATEISADLSGLKSRMDTAEDDIDNLETKITNLGTVFELKATVSSTQFEGWGGSVSSASTELNTTLEPGDVILVTYTDGVSDYNYNKEYVVVSEKVEEVETLKFELLGDPSGVTALADKVKTLQDTVGEHTTSIETLEGDIDNLSNEMTSKDNETLESAKSYTTEQIAALSNEGGAIKANADAIKTLNTTVANHTSSIESLGSSKLDKTTYEGKIKEIDETLTNKLDSSAAATTYLSKEDASATYATQATTSGLQSNLDTANSEITALKTTVNGAGETDTGLVGKVSSLETQVSTLTGVSNTTVSDVTQLKADVSTNANEIATLKTSVEQNTTNLATEVTNRTKAITEVKELITALETGAVKTNANDIDALEGRVGTVESDIAAIKSADETSGAAIKKNADDIAALSKKVTDEYETKIDATAKLQKAKDYTDDEVGKVTTVVDQLTSDIGKLSNIMNFVGDLEERYGTNNITKNYDDNSYVSGTEYTLTITIGTVDTKPGDVGIYGQQEYVCTKVTEIQEVVPATSTWVAIGAVGATEARFKTIEDNVSTIQTTMATADALTTATGQLTTAIENEQARAKAAEQANADAISGLDTRLTTAEGTIVDNTNAITEEVKRAKDAESALTSSFEKKLSWGEF